MDIYRELYSRSDYGRYANGSARLDKVAEWVTANVPENTDVLDYGAGRGYLIRKLLPLNRYRLHAWDSCAWLRENDLAELTGAVLFYLPPGFEGQMKFDCVVCSDVCEHMPNETAALALLDRIVGLSRKYVIVTIGIGRSNARGNIPSLDVELHSVRHNEKWWRGHIAQRVDIVAEEMILQSYLTFGTVKATEA